MNKEYIEKLYKFIKQYVNQYTPLQKKYIVNSDGGVKTLDEFITLMKVDLPMSLVC